MYLATFRVTGVNDYYKINMADEERWHLAVMDNFADSSEVDIWAYHRCTLLDRPKPVPFRIQVEGKRVDYNPTAFSATVVSRRMADLIEGVAPWDIQRIPAIVQEDRGEWEVINILACADCIDHDGSLIQYYPENHPTKAGKPRGVVRLILDPARIQGHHIFHPAGWHVATIVSDVLKAKLEELGATGIEYTRVTDAAW
jgi:hypothetical protein